MPVLPESLNKPLFCEAKKENGAAGKKKYGLTPRAKRAEFFFGVYFRERSEQKKIKFLSCQPVIWGSGEGAEQCPKPPTFFFLLPRDFPFFFFFSAKPQNRVFAVLKPQKST